MALIWMSGGCKGTTSFESTKFRGDKFAGNI